MLGLITSRPSIGLYSMDSIENAAEERVRDHFERKRGQEIQEIQERASKSVESVHEDNRRKESLLNEILPKSVADRLLKGEPVVTETYEAVTVFFSDIVGEFLMLPLLVLVYSAI